MEARDRLQHAMKMLMAHLKIKKQKEIGDMLGYQNQSSFSQIVTGTVPISDRFYNRLFATFPFLNEDYLLKGTGDVFKDGVDVRIEDVLTQYPYIIPDKKNTPVSNSDKSQLEELIEHNKKLTECIMLLVEQNKTLSDKLQALLNKL